MSRVTPAIRTSSSYVARLGYGYHVTIFATGAGPDGTRWLSEADAAEMKLPVHWFAEN
jgi:hypothetical protein